MKSPFPDVAVCCTGLLTANSGAYRQPTMMCVEPQQVRDTDQKSLKGWLEENGEASSPMALRSGANRDARRPSACGLQPRRSPEQAPSNLRGRFTFLQERLAV
jgi:hypothetical protein